jgi:TM2 domain-containing membrane protein YozV
MNCAQHTDQPAVAYCRSCGKALCESCERDVAGTVFCEPCLAERVHGTTAPGATVPPAGFAPVAAPEEASPGLALFLGFIPGVGAFYNGQVVKGFVHVIVLSTLIWLSEHGLGAFAGLMIMAWFFYMVYDAYTTAKARRFGMPLPDPLGLNYILEGRDGTFRQRVEQAGERLGQRVEQAAYQAGNHWKKAGGAVPNGSTPGATASNFTAAPNATPGAAPDGASSTPSGDVAGTTHDEVKGAVRDAVKAAANAATAAANMATDAVRNAQANANYQQGGAFYNGPQGTYYAPPPPVPPPPPRAASPAGAIVLIGLGGIFLLANLGWFSIRWVSHFWPAILIALGVWLVVKRQREAR